MMCDFKKSTESVGLKIQDELFQLPRIEQKKRGDDRQHQSRSLPVKERTKYLGQTITFKQQETTEIKSRIRAAWTSFAKKTDRS